MARPKKIPQILTDEEVGKIVSAIMNRDKREYGGLFTRYRDVTMIFLQYYLGLRPKECRCIRKSDIDLRKRKLFIPAENNKQRFQDTLPLPEFIVSLIKNYRLKIPKYMKTPWLFPSFLNPSLPVDDRRQRRVFEEACKKAELIHLSYVDANGRPKHNITLYSLRHSFATRVYSKNKDIIKTATLLRHYDFEYRSTLRYVHTARASQREILLEEVYS